MNNAISRFESHCLPVFIAAVLFGFIPSVFAKSYLPTSSGMTGKPQTVSIRNLPRGLSAMTSTAMQMPGPWLDNPEYLSEVQNVRVSPFWGGASPEEDSSRMVGDATNSDRSVINAPQSSSQGVTFSGVAYTGENPPDPVIAAGANYLVEAVNLSVAIYDKSGNQVYISTFQNFFGSLASGLFLYDPKLLYDQYSQRWVVLLLGSTNYEVAPSYYLIATSETSDPTAGWYLYKVGATFSDFYYSDFPGLGVDSTAIYVTSNQWNGSVTPNTFEYAQLFVFNKAEFYSGQSASYYVFRGNDLVNSDGTKAATVKPAHEYGTASAEFLVNIGTFYGFSNVTRNLITVWTVTSPLSNPQLNREATVTVGSYKNPPLAAQGGGGNAIVTDVASASDVVYIGGYAYTTFCTAYNWGGGTVSAIRYEKIDVSSNVATIDAVYGANGVYYYYPNIFADAVGDMALVFNESNSSQYIGVYWAIRTPSDAQMEPSQALQLGLGPYKVGGGNDRWGDYSGISLDPTTSNEFWMCGEYATTNQSEWGTAIGSVTANLGSGSKEIALTSVAKLPRSFALLQNYPNPFNPSTVITYELPSNSRVVLQVYDILGRRVATLVDGQQSAGIHEVKFNGSGLASGIYFYRITTQDYTKSDRMLLLK